MKYDYLEGFCPAYGYKGLYPATAEQDETSGYRYTGMACDLLETGKCNVSPCPVLSEYDPVVPKKHEWKLRDKKL